MTHSQKKSLCDEAVFEEVYKLYSKELYRFLTYTFKDSVLSEDTTQNVFLKLWDQCKQYNMNNIKSLIFTMGKNLTLNELKRNRKTQSEEITQIQFSESPHNLLESKQFKEQLSKAINQLSEKERLVFLLNRIDQLTYKEIAIRLEISQKTVEKRMHNALKKLNYLLAVDFKKI